MTWFLLILCLLLSFVLSGLESAVLAVSRVRVRHAASEGDARARGLLPLLEDRDALIGCITVANHLTNLGAFVLIALPIVNQTGVWSQIAAFILGLPLFLVGLEVMPKKLFRRYPFRSLRAVWPLVHLVGFARPIFRAFARKGDADTESADSNKARQLRGRENLKSLARQLASQRQLSSAATRLIERVLDYRNLQTADLMQPLTRSVALAAEMPAHTARIIARQQNSPLLPVLGENGDFIGVLDTAELPPSLPNDRLVRQHMRALGAPLSANLPALHALRRMRRQGRRLAIVADAQQSPLGLVTEENLLRPLMP